MNVEPKGNIPSRSFKITFADQTSAQLRSSTVYRINLSKEEKKTSAA
jgi:hypothetical protein